jgi:hypothetical protein
MKTDFTAETAAASTIHHPLGRPGGPGLFGVKGMQLPAYIQNIAHALIRQGKTKSTAIQMAIGIVQRWARGQGGVSPEVKAAAVKALAEWEAERVRAKVDNSGLHVRVIDMASAQDGSLITSNFYLYDPKTLQAMATPDLAKHYGDSIKRLGRQHEYTASVASVLQKRVKVEGFPKA